MLRKLLLSFCLLPMAMYVFAACTGNDPCDPTNCGDLNVNIDPQMVEPIFLTMTGMLAQMNPGDTMTANVAVNTEMTVPAVDEAVVYYWYENGIYQGTGDTISLTADALNMGSLNQYYRVDVIAYTADGLRAGSDTFTYEVTEL